MKRVKAKPTIVDAIKFDSKLEAEGYEVIKKVVPLEWIKIKHKLLLKPKTVNFPPIYWKVDFRIESPTGKFLNIEIKGTPSREFTRGLRLLEYTSYQEWKRVIVVSDDVKVLNHLQKTIPMLMLKRKLIAFVAETVGTVGRERAQTCRGISIE